MNSGLQGWVREVEKQKEFKYHSLALGAFFSFFLASSICLIMLKEGQGLVRSILIIHIFSFSQSTSARVSAPSFCSILQETGLEILEQQYFHPPILPIAKEYHQNCNEWPLLASEGSITPQSPQMHSPLLMLEKSTLAWSFSPACPMVLNSSKLEGMEGIFKQSRSQYQMETPMTLEPLMRTKDQPEARAGRILPLIMGQISSYLGLWLFQMVLSQRKLLVRTPAAWSTCSSRNSVMQVYDFMQMIMLTSSL